MNKSNKTLIKSITISGILILAVLLNTSLINQTFAKKDNKISKEDNVGQNVADNQANHCKASMKLSAQWYSPYRTLMIRGTLTCGDSGLDGKTIVLLDFDGYSKYHQNFAFFILEQLIQI